MPNVTVTIDGQVVENIKGVTVAITTGTTPPPIDPPPIDPPPIDPPPVIIPPPDLGDAVSWPSVFEGTYFGQYKSYRVTARIPAEGLYIYFRGRDVASFLAAFMCVERRSLPAPLNMSLSESVGDMVGLANARMVNHDMTITGGYPTGRDCILHPDRTYFWNFKWERAVADHVYLESVYRSP